MKERTFLYDDGENFIIWSTDDKSAELICVKGDRVFYYVPNRLLDMVLFTQLMEKMNFGENDQNNIRNVVMEKYDEWKAANKYKPTCKTYTFEITGIKCKEEDVY